MKCYCCQACRTEGYEYPETVCILESLSDECQTEWKDGEPGCTLNGVKVHSLVKKADNAYAEQYRYIGEWVNANDYKDRTGIDVYDPNGKHVSFAKHCIGLDHSKPYTRHGKKYYKPYRNYYDAGPADVEVWDSLAEIGFAGKDGSYYWLTDAGRDWLGNVLKITIKEEER